MSPTAAAMSDQPLFSIVLPVYDPPLVLLKKCIRSVLTQTFDNWELCVVDDASPSRNVTRTLLRAASRDRRIRLVHHERNTGITESTRHAVAMSRGCFVVFLDHDDALSKRALEKFAAVITDDSAVEFIYSDEEIVDSATSPHVIFKPDFSPVRLLSQNYISHLVGVKKELLERAGGVRDGFEGAQDYDIYLRTTALASKVAHVREALYRWNILESSYSQDTNSRQLVESAGLHALRDHLSSRGVTELSAEQSSRKGCFGLWTGTGHTGSVTIVKAPWSLIGNHEQLIRHRPPSEVGDRVTLASLTQQIVGADSDFVVIVNDALIEIDQSRCRLLSQYLNLDSVGVVAPLLISRDGFVVSSGHFHREGRIVRAGYGILHSDHQILGPLETVRDVLSVGFELVALRKDAFIDVGGFSGDIDPRMALVDLCLKMRSKKWSVAVDPRVVITVNEPYSEVLAIAGDDEFSTRWWSDLHYDPFDWVPTTIERPNNRSNRRHNFLSRRN